MKRRYLKLTKKESKILKMVNNKIIVNHNSLFLNHRILKEIEIIIVIIPGTPLILLFSLMELCNKLIRKINKKEI